MQNRKWIIHDDRTATIQKKWIIKNSISTDGNCAPLSSILSLSPEEPIGMKRNDE